ncbi:MAG: hypothetical protein DHS20C18_40530 [Saprospiraceae bacterium]|nr:MAG: hypothetical protein DHS20C18_40530 [Saprospiraceae bacterium]
MNAQHNEPKIKEMVEEVGVLMEQRGMSPMPGRVLAFLLLSEPPYRSFYDIQEFLAASKSAISNSLQKLMDSGIVDYITFSGDRKRYFRVNLKKWMEVSKNDFSKIREIEAFFKKTLALRKDTKFLEFNEEIERLLEFHQFMAAKIPHLIEEFEKRYNKE